MDSAIKLVQEGKTFAFVLENIDRDVRVHGMRFESQNKSVHAVATSIVFARASSNHLPDDGPKNNLANVNLRELLNCTDEEKRCTREHYKIFLGKFPALDFLVDVVPTCTPCQYQAEMGTHFVVVLLPVLMKDEKKYSDLVDVLDRLEVWVREIYAKAGRCAPPDEDHVPPGPPIAVHSRPDQAASHVPPVLSVEDPLAKVQIPLFW